MFAHPQTTTCAGHIAVCRNCRKPISSVAMDERGNTVIWPCGHPALISLIPNPDVPATGGDQSA